MAQLATGMLCVVYTALVTPFSIEWEYVTPWVESSRETRKKIGAKQDRVSESTR